MKFSHPGALGAVIGWFIISPLFSYAREKPSFIDLLSHSTLGLLTAILFGFLFGYIFNKQKVKRNNKIKMIVHKCDNCGEEDKEAFRPIVVTCGYGSKHDGQEFDFCSEKCLLEFFTEDKNGKHD